MITTSPDRAEDIRLIRESAAAIAQRGDLGRIRKLRFDRPGFDRQVYAAMADMGWTGLITPEDRGGSGLGMLELCALAEEFGACLVPEPLLCGAVVAPHLDGLERDGAISGERIVLLAWAEAANSFSPGTTTHFQRGRVSGVKRFVWMAEGADAFLVTCAEGMAVVSASAVQRETHSTQDGGHYCTLSFENADGLLVKGDQHRLLDRCALVTSAYLLGVIQGALALTLEYVKTRRQFGSPIGSFQVIQHRLVDLALQASLTQASVEQAAKLVDDGAGSQVTAAAISKAKVRASEASLLVTRQCVQMHGGIGYTDEAEIGLFLRKAMVLAASFGSAQLHRDRYSHLVLDNRL